MNEARAALPARRLAHVSVNSIAAWLSLEDAVQHTIADHDTALLLGKTLQLDPPLSGSGAPVEANRLLDDAFFVMLLNFRG